MLRRVFETAIREFRATALTKAFIFGTFVLPVVIWGVLGAAGAAGLFNPTPEPLVGTIAIIDRTNGDSVAPKVEAYFDPAAQKARADANAARMREFAQQFGLMAAPTTDDGAEAAPPTEAPAQDGETAPEEGEAADSAAPAGPPQDEVRVTLLDDEIELASLDERIRNGELLAAALIDGNSLAPDKGVFSLKTAQSVKRQQANKIENAIEDAIIAQRFEMQSLDRALASSLSSRPRAQAATVTESGETKGGDAAQVFVPLAAVMLLLMAIFIGASYLLMSTVEEKNSRVMEVLLSAISPLELMTGKIIGQGLVGLVILVIYGGVGIYAARQFNFGDFVGPGMLTLLTVYFLIGYFMFAAVMAAIGSAVTEIREAQSLQGPVFGVVILFVYLAIFAGMQDTNNMLSRVLSFVPPAIPFVMPMRLANPAAPPATWEIAATIAIGLVSVVVLVWAAAKIFRIGVLMYGKPPSLMGLIKWIRMA
ncbi:MAG: ABC transporter permease [Phycisphaerales bacterium]